MALASLMLSAFPPSFLLPATPRRSRALVLADARLSYPLFPPRCTRALCAADARLSLGPFLLLWIPAYVRLDSLSFL